jgi:hypothetical protein
MNESLLALHTHKFQRALDQLRSRMDEAVEGPGRPGVVFLLGAGCSMQYGLPGFQSLLAAVCRDLYGDEPDWDKLEVPSLRHQLEDVFKDNDGEARASLRRHLGNVNGEDCPAYRVLANLMAAGFVKATVTMNFDTLLDDALIAEGHYEIANDPTRVLRIHGSLGPLPSSDPKPPILNVEATEFFDATHGNKVTKLLTTNHVVAIGYSGVDAKVVEALSQDPVNSGGSAVIKEPCRLFFVALALTDNRIRKAIEARRSDRFVITGAEGTFENFMQGLEATRRYKEAHHHRSALPPEKTKLPKSTELTTLELEALERCLKLALRIRTAMNVADASDTSIEQHGDDLFALCLELARHTRLRLTSPEKYLLYCASYLHDLGYFRAYSGGGIGQHPGWELLRNHGDLTAKLLEEHFRDAQRLRDPSRDGKSDARSLRPISYNSEQPEKDAKLEAMLIELCRRHPGFDTGPIQNPSFDKHKDTLYVGPYPVRVRFDLLDALLSTAEEISPGHPFLPSGDPIDPRPTPDFVIDDPVLDIYLRRKQQLIRFEISRDGIHAQRVPNTPPPDDAVIDWLVMLAKRATDVLSETASAYDGDPLEFHSDLHDMRPLPKDAKDRTDLHTDLLDSALSERLRSQLRDEDAKSPGAALRILDLLALYTLDPVQSQLAAEGATATGNKRPPEPRAPVGSQAVREARRMLDLAGDDPHVGLLGRYIRGFLDGEVTRAAELPALDQCFFTDVRDICLPAWRFCAQRWQRGMSPLVMACASLELGSTLHRSEVTYGMRSLPVCPAPAADDGAAASPDQRSGHDGCTLCTGRLLYVLSYALLLGRPGFEFQVGETNAAGAHEAIADILRYVLAPKDPDVWWGVERELARAKRHPGENRGRHRPTNDFIQAADYIASAVRATGFALWVDFRLEAHSARGFLDGKQRTQLRTLFLALLRDLCQAPAKKLLHQRSEEPHSYVLGEAARTYLSLQRLRPWSVRQGRLVADLLAKGRRNLRDAVTELSAGSVSQSGNQLSQLSQYYLLPAFAFLHGTAQSRRDRNYWKHILWDTYRGCAGSSIWIKQGNDAGSWGYNLENTARLVLVLSAFWRHAFDHRGEFEELAGGHPQRALRSRSARSQAREA